MINQAIVDEREACAKIADEWIGQQPGDLDVAEEIAARIRSRAKPE